jgi:subtilisin family serine protease
VGIKDFNREEGLPSTTPRMDLFKWSPYGDIENFEYFTRAGSLTFPGAISNVMSVAAICWQNDRLEDYSSQGPTPDGRLKPDIAGQSVVSTSFQTFTACPANSSGTGGFNGTSAAAPHVSGAAALVKGANPSFTPAQVQAFLEARAVDLGTAGKDPLFGSGKLQLGAAPDPPVTCAPRPAVTLQTAVSGGRLAVTVLVSGANNRLVNLAFGNVPRTPSNALLDLPDGRTGLTGTPSYTPPPGAAQTTFWVRRQVPGAPVFVPFIVNDLCGGWPTFVGGGTGPSAAGF